MHTKKNNYYILKKVITAITVILMIFSVSGCSYQKKDEEELKEKNIAELQYLDDYLLLMLNNMNNITLQEYDMIIKESTENVNEISKEDEATESNSTNFNMISSMILSNSKGFSWESMGIQIERLNTSWPAILVDLSKANVDSRKITEFSDNLNICVGHIKNKDKNNTMASLAKLYGLVAIYTEQINEEESNINIAKTKSNIVYAYINIELEKWDDINNYLDLAKKNFEPVTKDTNLSEKQYNINKAYILIQEFKKAVGNKDKELLYMKYKDTMEELIIL